LQDRIGQPFESGLIHGGNYNDGPQGGRIQ
jgi:hypothetical protein